MIQITTAVEPRVASMMAMKGRGKGRGVMDTSLKRRRGGDSIRRPLTSRPALSQGRPARLQEPLLDEDEVANEDDAPRPEPAPLPRQTPLPREAPLPEENEDEPEADPAAPFPHGDDEGNEQLRRVGRVPPGYRAPPQAWVRTRNQVPEAPQPKSRIFEGCESPAG